MFSEFDLCFQPGFLRAVYLLKTLLNVIRIAVPIGVIIKSILDIYKGILDPKDKDGLNSLKNRFIAMVIVFLVPTIINAFMGLINYVMERDVYNGVTECWTFASPEYINILQEQYDNRLDELFEMEKQQQQTYRDKAKELLQKIIAARSTVGAYANNKNQILCGSGPQYNGGLESAVKAAGTTTRAGVLAAANYLSSHINVHIPYYWSGGHFHKYVADFEPFTETRTTMLGLSKYWGCEVELPYSPGTDKQHTGEYYSFGMDCSGFIVWALLNGGYKENVCSFGTDSGILSSFCGVDVESVSFKDSKNFVKPGDIAYRDGHVGMIVEVHNDKLLIAEEAGADSGLIVSEQSFSSTRGFTHIILMDNFYNIKK